VIAKMPVLDPGSPVQAREMAKLAFDLSEAFEIPVMLRPTTRVCHSRQGMAVQALTPETRSADFQKDPGPLGRHPPNSGSSSTSSWRKSWKKLPPMSPHGRGLVAGTPGAGGQGHCGGGRGRGQCPGHRPGTEPGYSGIPGHPALSLHRAFVEQMAAYDDILVLEETWGVIEMQFADGRRVRGKTSGFVSRTGELLPEDIEALICEFAGLAHTPEKITQMPGRRPTLCAGCPHRAAFFAIKKAAPKGIFTSDIGCYTLGANLGAVDTVTCMGAGISQAAGFSIAYQSHEKPPKIFSTIGDSTFFHSGIPGLIETVVKKIPYVLVILDNRTTAMTGHQPTPASGTDAMGEACASVDIPKIVEGCGVQFVKTADPYDLKDFIALLKEAQDYCRDNGPAVVIAEHPCLLDMDREELKKGATPMAVDTDICDGCGYCTSHFECPALSSDAENNVTVLDQSLCSGCGVCASVCPKGALHVRSNHNDL
jgi:indolepyruvate ferredoxin oxidoreductase alpha subunit